MAKTTKSPKSSGGFKLSDYIVYPTHGVGRISEIERQEIAGMELEMFVIAFEQDKMTLRVPTSKIESTGMRKLSEPATVLSAMKTLKGRCPLWWKPSPPLPIRSTVILTPPAIT